MEDCAGSQSEGGIVFVDYQQLFWQFEFLSRSVGKKVGLRSPARESGEGQL